MDRLATQGRDRLAPREPQEGGFIEGVQSDLAQRQQSVQKGISQGDNPLSTGFQAVGQGIGLLGDVLLRGLGAVTPDVIEKPIVGAIQSGVKKVAQTDTAQRITKSVTDWAAQNPEAARNLESVINVASILPLGKGATAAGKVAKTGVAKTGEALEKSGLKALEAEKASFARRLIRPIQTSKVKVEQVGRTTETGVGPFKRSIIQPTAQELRAEQAILSIPNLSPTKTFQQNYNLISQANRIESQSLQTALRGSDFFYTKNVLRDKLDGVAARLAQNPALVGDSQKTARKIVAKAKEIIDSKPPTGSSLLQARKELDRFIESQKGGNVFDPKTDNAFTIALREVRQEINTFLDEQAVIKGVPKRVRESLSRQSALYDALENIAPKAAQEANTAIGRAFQRMMEAVGLKNKIVQQIATIVGIGGLGAAATFAPMAALIGVGGFVTYEGGKLLLKPGLRVKLGELLREFSRTAPKSPENQAIIQKAQEILKSSEIDTDKLLFRPQRGIDSVTGKPQKTGLGGVTRSSQKLEKTSVIPKDLQPLAQEAKKYKSAEEFVKAQPTVYHGSNAKFDNFDFKKTGLASGEKPLHGLEGAWFVDNRAVASGYGKNIKEASIDTKNFYTVDAKGKTLNDFRDELWDAKKLVKDQSKDGLIVKNLIDNADYSKGDIGTHIFVVNKNALKTKSQLTDFYNQVNKK